MAVGKVKTTSFLNKKFGREREMQSTYPETIIFYNLFLSNLCFWYTVLLKLSKNPDYSVIFLWVNSFLRYNSHTNLGSSIQCFLACTQSCVIITTFQFLNISIYAKVKQYTLKRSLPISPSATHW
jgi:hypothetical protein